MNQDILIEKLYFIYVSFLCILQLLQPIKNIAPLVINDAQKDYVIYLLSAVCQIINTQVGECQTEAVPMPILQQRQLNSLNKGLLDVVWSVTNKEREANYRAIRIPLMKGLIGARIATVNSTYFALFNQAELDLPKSNRYVLYKATIGRMSTFTSQWI